MQLLYLPYLPVGLYKEKTMRCQFCEKQKEGRCTAKKNVSIKLKKKRTCTKYVFDKKKEQEELKRRMNAIKDGRSPMIHKLTQAYYDNIWTQLEIMRTPGARHKLMRGEKR
jgi:hypothetical protein